MKARVGSSCSTSTSASSLSTADLTFDESFTRVVGDAIDAVARAGDTHFASFAHSSRDLFKSSTSRTPKIAMRDYLHRLLKYIDGKEQSNSWSELSPGARALIAALLYIDRISRRIPVDSQRIHRMIATGILVALKFNEDAMVDMHFFANLSGIRFSQLRELEAFFLEVLDWDVTVSSSEFKSRIAMFEKFTTGRNSSILLTGKESRSRDLPSPPPA